MQRHIFLPNFLLTSSISREDFTLLSLLFLSPSLSLSLSPSLSLSLSHIEEDEDDTISFICERFLDINVSSKLLLNNLLLTFDTPNRVVPIRLSILFCITKLFFISVFLHSSFMFSISFVIMDLAL